MNKLIYLSALCWIATVSLADLLGDSTDSIFGKIDRDLMPMAFLGLKRLLKYSFF